MNAHELIHNHQLVLEAFGRWPSFHDAEVHSALLDRTRKFDNGSFYPSVELVIHGWNMTSEITDKGYYKLENQNLVHFIFEEVSDLELDGLNHQNVISSLDLSLQKNKSGESLFFVELAHCYGLSGSFKAKRASIESVIPYSGEETANPAFKRDALKRAP